MTTMPYYFVVDKISMAITIHNRNGLELYSSKLTSIDITRIGEISNLDEGSFLNSSGQIKCYLYSSYDDPTEGIKGFDDYFWYCYMKRYSRLIRFMMDYEKK